MGLRPTKLSPVPLRVQSVESIRLKFRIAELMAEHFLINLLNRRTKTYCITTKHMVDMRLYIVAFIVNN